MLRSELVDRERWISSQRFNRALAVYQILPGPEAHELCCYFGHLARGRLGALLAGLGFMLPGLVFMLALAWFYVRYGLTAPLLIAAFAGIKPAVAALVARAVHRIGGHALRSDRWLWAIAIVSFAASLAGAHFSIPLLAGGIAFAFGAGKRAWLGVTCLATVVAVATWPATHPAFAMQVLDSQTLQAPAHHASLLWSGLKAGLLTFGGAYTVIPFLRQDAVQRNAWLSEDQFLDGIGLSGVLPAPLVIFGTFVGYLAGGLPGALLLTAGIFGPAFAFTIIGHGYIEKLVNYPRIHRFLDGVTAAVVGLIAATAIAILQASIRSWPAAAIFAAALVLAFIWKSKAAVPVLVLSSACLGALLLSPDVPLRS